jgi:hypothetical protein
VGNVGVVDGYVEGFIRVKITNLAREFKIFRSRISADTLSERAGSGCPLPGCFSTFNHAGAHALRCGGWGVIVN